MKNGRKLVSILDSSNHAMRLMSICKKEETEEEGVQLWKYMYLNSIFQYIETFEIDEFIIALDSRNNWRKNIFPFYKGNRKLIRKDVDEEEGWFNYKKYFEIYDAFIEEVSVNLPLKIIKIDYTEADDIAGVLCESEELRDSFKLLISTDKDYIQLLSCPFTMLYNPINKEYVKVENPKNELLKKIVMGDKSDFVPSINDRHVFKEEFIQFCINENIAENSVNAKIKLENDENLLLSSCLKFQEKYGIKPSKIMRFSEKLANSLIENKELENYLKDKEDIKQRFLRNNRLVNLKMQPKTIKTQIIETYKETIKKKHDIRKLFEYFVGNTFIDFINNSSRITRILEPLYV